MKKQLLAHHLAAIQQKTKLAREAWLEGEIEKAEELLEEAWSTIPVPAVEYSYAQILSSSIVIFYRDTKQFEKAIKWLDVVAAAYPGPDDPTVVFLAATVYFAAGDKGKAYALFDGLFQRFKERPFQGKDPEYLAFYRNMKRERGAEPL